MNAEPANGQPAISPELWRAEPSAVRPRPSVLRERPRQLILIGCVAVIAGVLIQPYASGSEFEGTRSYVWIADVPDVGYVIALSIVLAGFGLSRGATESRQRIVHLAPLALAVSLGAIVAQIVRALLLTIDRWLSGELGVGPWLAMLGSVLVLLGTTWLLVRHWPAAADRQGAPEVEAVPTERIGSGTSSEALGVVAGLLAGFALAVPISSWILPAGVPLRELITILVVSLGGAWLGMLVGRRLGLG